MRQMSRRVLRFVGIQFLALIGWVAVQSFFSLSSFGQALPFAVVIFVEGVWWGGLLFVMFLLFRGEYRRFAQAAIDLEDANTRLRESTNRLFQQIRQEQAQEQLEHAEAVEEAEVVGEIERVRAVEVAKEQPVSKEA